MKGWLIVIKWKNTMQENGDMRRNIAAKDFVQYLTLTFTKSS
jgi:hypothetical protein